VIGGQAARVLRAAIEGAHAMRRHWRHCQELLSECVPTISCGPSDILWLSDVVPKVDRINVLYLRISRLPFPRLHSMWPFHNKLGV
jgi:hypothetical protein